MRLLLIALIGLGGASIAALGAGGVPLPPRAQEAAPAAFEVSRTERMLENRVACRGCHVIAGRGGAIGPSLDGIASRADAEYVRSVIVDPTSTIPGTLMPRQRIPDREVERLTAYLLSLPASPAATAVTPQAPPPLAEADGEDGAALYARHCASCHGDSGGGDGWNAPNLPVPPTAHADPALMERRTDDSLFDAIHAGAFVLDGSPRMPAYGESLSTAQIRALVGHIRTLCGCEQPAWAGGA